MTPLSLPPLCWWSVFSFFVQAADGEEAATGTAEAAPAEDSAVRLSSAMLGLFMYTMPLLPLQVLTFGAVIYLRHSNGVMAPGVTPVVVRSPTARKKRRLRRTSGTPKKAKRHVVYFMALGVRHPLTPLTQGGRVHATDGSSIETNTNM